MPIRHEFSVFFALFSLICVDASAQHADPILERIKLPPGFKISVFAEAPSVRSSLSARPATFVNRKAMKARSYA